MASRLLRPTVGSQASGSGGSIVVFFAVVVRPRVFTVPLASPPQIGQQFGPADERWSGEADTPARLGLPTQPHIFPRRLVVRTECDWSVADRQNAFALSGHGPPASRLVIRQDFLLYAMLSSDVARELKKRGVSEDEVLKDFEASRGKPRAARRRR